MTSACKILNLVSHICSHSKFLDSNSEKKKRKERKEGKNKGKEVGKDREKKERRKKKSSKTKLRRDVGHIVDPD